MLTSSAFPLAARADDHSEKHHNDENEHLCRRAPVPSQAAKDAKAAGLQLITWTLERSGRIVEEVLPTKGTATPSSYYQTTFDALKNDGDILVTLDVLAKQVGIIGICSDWAGTVSYYASCMALK